MIEALTKTGVEALESTVTPALTLHRVKVDRSIAHLRGYISNLGVGFRPHVKAAKSLDVAKGLFPTGEGGTPVSSLAEAEYFAHGGFTDITYAFGLAPEKIGRTCDLVADGADISVLIDTVEQTRALADHACKASHMPAVLVEIDCDGHRGCPLPSQHEAYRVIERWRPQYSRRLAADSELVTVQARAEQDV